MTDEKVINQAIADFDSIEAAIEECGVNIPYGTDTSEYGRYIKEAHQAWRTKIMGAFQQYGARTNYENAFHRWHHDGIYPVHHMICTNCDRMFYSINANGETFDLSARLRECGVRLDTSACTSFDYSFYGCKSTTIPELDTRGANKVANVFPSTLTVVTVDNLILRDDGSQTFNNVWDWSSAIENIKITGKIGQNGFTVSSLYNLTRESLLSIINALQDKSSDTSGTTWIVTFGTTNLSKLTAEEKQLAENKGWNLR